MSFKPRMTFINLPVKDLQKTMNFFSNIGFTFNPRFTDDQAACMVINDHTCAMLITEARFRQFTNKTIIDAKEHVEVLLALSADSREQVDEVVNIAIESGGSRASDPVDHGFMYQASFADPDGHVWEILYMDPAAIQ